jgi:hypothetical protein
MFPKPIRNKRKPKRIAAKRDKSKRLCVDKEATVLQGFFDPRSYIALDGRWICEGADMGRQRFRAYMRDQRRGCYVCKNRLSWGGFELHHVKAKGKFPRDDRLENLACVCNHWTVNRCHAKLHNREPKWRKP